MHTSKVSSASYCPKSNVACVQLSIGCNAWPDAVSGFSNMSQGICEEVLFLSLTIDLRILVQPDGEVVVLFAN